jgi:hypothetical protein
MYQIQQFFNHYDTPDYHRYMVASYHMECESLTWLEEMELRGVFTNLKDWNSFVKLIQIRFGHPAKDPSCQKNLPEKPQPKTTAPPKINPSVEPLPKPTTPPTPPKIPTMFTHHLTIPSLTLPTLETSKPSHPLHDLLNPTLSTHQDRPLSATKQKTQTKKTTPTVETLPLSH